MENWWWILEFQSTSARFMHKRSQNLVLHAHTRRQSTIPKKGKFCCCCFVVSVAFFCSRKQNKRNIENKMVYHMNGNRWMNEAKDIPVHLNKPNNVSDTEWNYTWRLVNSIIIPRVYVKWGRAAEVDTLVPNQKKNGTCRIQPTRKENISHHP